MIEEYKCQAYGPSGGHIKGITKPLHDNENFTILDRYKFRAFSAPGHTNDQLSYFFFWGYIILCWLWKIV